MTKNFGILTSRVEDDKMKNIFVRTENFRLSEYRTSSDILTTLSDGRKIFVRPEQIFVRHFNSAEPQIRCT